ncbi:MAG: proprotein convertase P-domain-containing protein, partial [Gemmataceae bacterium]
MLAKIGYLLFQSGEPRAQLNEGNVAIEIQHPTKSTRDHGVRRPCHRPSIENLEDRLTPTPIVTLPIPDVFVQEDAPNTVFNLRNHFHDPAFGVDSLTFSVFFNSNPGLFASTDINSGLLTLDYLDDANGSATLVIRATDIHGIFIDDGFNVEVASVNDEPINTVPTSIEIDEDISTYVSGISVSDVDAAALTVTLTATHGVLSVRTDVSGGLTADDVTGNDSASVTLTGTSDAINATLANATGLHYQPTADYFGLDSIVVHTVDDLGLIDEDSIPVTINARNDAPVNSVPAFIDAYEDGSTYVTGISVSDVDSATLTVTLTAIQGTFTVRTNVSGGLTADDVVGNNTSSVTLTGTAAAINATITNSTGLRYQAPAGFFGYDTISVQTDDGGGGSDSDSIPVTVHAVRVYDSLDVPVSIPQKGTITSTLFVADSYALADLNVLLNIAHTYDGDLQVFLQGPDGTEIKLINNVGGSGNHFTNTVLDDQAAASITSGAAPYTGSFRPAEPLAAFIGNNVHGVWTLRVVDQFTGDAGNLLGWSLIVDPDTAYVSANVPLRIPASGTTGTINSTLVVTDAFSIRDVEVLLDISHTYDEDLFVTLVGPDGTVVQLLNQVGGSGVNFANTHLDDEALQGIGSGSAPFSGRYRPSQSLTAFDGHQAQGTWTLRIQDLNNGDSGFLNSWQLLLDV